MMHQHTTYLISKLQGFEGTFVMLGAKPQWPTVPVRKYFRNYGAATCNKTRAARLVAFRASPGTLQQAGIVTRLIGKQVAQLDSNTKVVPLLDPLKHQLPFAASLHIHQSAGWDTADLPQRSRTERLTANLTQASAKGQSLVELSYVLSGSGILTTLSGAVQPISIGDSIIALQGEVTCTAEPVALSAVYNPAAHNSSAALAHLELSSGTSQHSNSVAQQQQQQRQHANPKLDEQPLVILQLLLPSELLTGELESHHAGHCQQVAQQVPWAADAGAKPQGLIDARAACELLGSGLLQMSMQFQQQQKSSMQQPADKLCTEQQLQSVSSSNGSSSNASSNGSNGSNQQDSSGHFQPLSPRQVLVRALSEVGAFRIPDQTNRLALLFGPHASPAVSLSFGVEQFQPGHVTPLHTHKGAHELFFVLAGRGVGVHGDAKQQQRVEMSVGDVAVFPPGVLHGVDNESSEQLYCLQMMLPNEHFVEWVRSGEAAGTLNVQDLQRLATAASCG